MPSKARGQSGPHREVTCTPSPLFHQGLVRPWCLTWAACQPRGHFVTNQRGGHQGVISLGFSCSLFVILIFLARVLPPSRHLAVHGMGVGEGKPRWPKIFFTGALIFWTQFSLESFPMVLSFKMTTSIFYKVGVISGPPNISWFLHYGAWAVTSQRTLPFQCWAGMPNAVS